MYIYTLASLSPIHFYEKLFKLHNRLNYFAIVTSQHKKLVLQIFFCNIALNHAIKFQAESRRLSKHSKKDWPFKPVVISIHTYDIFVQTIWEFKFFPGIQRRRQNIIKCCGKESCNNFALRKKNITTVTQKSTTDMIKLLESQASSLTPETTKTPSNTLIQPDDIPEIVTPTAMAVRSIFLYHL